MLRGLYTSYTGMYNEQKRLDIISNNIANAATTGYKEESVTSQAFDQMLAIKIRDGSDAYINRPIGKMSLGVKLGEVYSNFEQGSIRNTGNTYDLAISGKGFFAVRVENKNGESSIKYTRDGNFTIDSEGYVLDSKGNHLQGRDGDLQIPVGATDVAISKDGLVTADGVVVGYIDLVDFKDYDYLEKFGDTQYTATEGAEFTDTSATIEQCYIEQSNVNVVSEMVNMITITRAYEANQRVMKTVDTLLDKAANNVGRV